MDSNKAGSCLCKAVRFEIEGDFDRFYICHCEHCRKDTGSAFAANLFSSKARLRWVAGEENVRAFNLPATRHVKSFCEICGSALPSVQAHGRLLVVPAGSLDHELSIKPTAHIFVSSRASWEANLENIPLFEKLPS